MYIMNSQEIASVDLEKRIALLVDLLVHIHTECKTVEYDPDQWHFHKCSSIALMHIFMEKHRINPLMIVLERARQTLGETLMLDPTILDALMTSGCKVTKVSKTEYRHSD